MGIRNFKKLFKLIPFQKAKLKNNILLIDGSIMLYSKKKTIEEVVADLIKLNEKFGSFPYVILDGARNSKKNRVKTSEEVKIVEKKRKHFIEALRARGIPYLVAPEEADHQMAFMAKKNADMYILSKDTDCILHGLINNLVDRCALAAHNSWEDIRTIQDTKLSCDDIFNQIKGRCDYPDPKIGFLDHTVYDYNIRKCVHYQSEAEVNWFRDPVLWSLGFFDSLGSA